VLFVGLQAQAARDVFDVALQNPAELVAQADEGRALVRGRAALVFLVGLMKVPGKGL
jgi:hypothetical protein